ncbi:hypothetical protein EDD11_008800, partial [Mortierella claussenii]
KLGLKAMQVVEQQALADGQTDEQDEDSSEARELDNWIEVKSTKERFLVATAPTDSIYGETYTQRLDELKMILLTDKINCIDGPTKAKGQNGETVYRVAVVTQRDMDLLLEISVSEELEDGTMAEQQLFTRIDNTRRVSEQERTVEVYGLHFRTDDFHIRSTMTQFGDIEKINTRPCTNGLNIAVRVAFRNVEACSAFTAIVPHMMHENKGSTVPKEMLQAAGLIMELHRNVVKNDEGKGKAVDNPRNTRQYRQDSGVGFPEAKATPAADSEE